MSKWKGLFPEDHENEEQEQKEEPSVSSSSAYKKLEAELIEKGLVVTEQQETAK